MLVLAYCLLFVMLLHGVVLMEVTRSESEHRITHDVVHCFPRHVNMKIKNLHWRDLNAGRVHSAMEGESSPFFVPNCWENSLSLFKFPITLVSSIYLLPGIFPVCLSACLPVCLSFCVSVSLSLFVHIIYLQAGMYYVRNSCMYAER